MAEWSKAVHLRCTLRKEAWVRTPLLATFFLIFIIKSKKIDSFFLLIHILPIWPSGLRRGT